MCYGQNTNERSVALDNIIEPLIADSFWSKHPCSMRMLKEET